MTDQMVIIAVLAGIGLLISLGTLYTYMVVHSDDINKPKKGDRYYFITHNGRIFRIDCNLWSDDPIDYERYADSNCFPSRIAADKVLRKMKEVLHNG